MEQLFGGKSISNIIEKMTALAGCASFEAQVEKGDGLTVNVAQGVVRITACDLNAVARGVFLAALAVKANTDLHLTQSRHFKECGAMVDMSRGGVMHVEAVKHMLDVMAALGMNTLQLYTEDTYTVPEYPYFGYLRGRYTKEELRALDDYADALGIELVPCIQTLAHLGQFLQWKSSAHMKDQPTVLLIDDEDTYKFIEAEIRAVRDCFRSRQIHIGMDEAHGVGLGEYFAKHGLVNRFELLNRHLDRVVKICNQYGFDRPMMWSDMFFRLGSKTNDYYDLSVHVPDEIIAGIPDVRLVYWDYYNMDPAVYDAMFKEHARLKADTVFAGGVWTWSGFLPQIERTRRTMRPGLTESMKFGVSTVLATLWGDDGAETAYSLAYSLFPMFSEACWTGAVPSDEEVSRLGQAVSGVPGEAFEAWAKFYKDETDQRNGKGFVYTDLLYPLVENEESAKAVFERCHAGAKTLEKYRGSVSCDYAHALLTVAAHKADIVSKLRDSYVNGDKAYLAKVASAEIPALIGETDTLMRAHKRLWNETFKRNGWEVLSLRYGALTGRLVDVQEELLAYLKGELATIPELDETPLPSARKGGMQYYQVYVAPGFSI